MNNVRRLIILFALLLLPGLLIAADLAEYSFVQEVSGRRYECRFSNEAVGRDRGWKAGEDFPLSPDKACSLAHDALAQTPFASSQWKLEQIQLTKLGMGVWLYEITYIRPNTNGLAGNERVIVPVSLGGDPASFKSVQGPSPIQSPIHSSDR